MNEQITLRPFREQDLGFFELLSMDSDAVGPFTWAGFTDPRARRRRWEADGYIGTESTGVAVVLGEGTLAGMVGWEAKPRGGPPGGCYEIGITLLPEYRGRGLGTVAQRLLVNHLFTWTPVQRLEAQTDVDNIAEQTALERVGFQREGLLRAARFRQGSWRDMVIYGLLRAELPDLVT
jgi:[ribosomal protein S5]-alanine N-acetyltransferase